MECAINESRENEGKTNVSFKHKGNQRSVESSKQLQCFASLSWLWLAEALCFGFKSKNELSCMTTSEGASQDKNKECEG